MLWAELEDNNKAKVAELEAIHRRHAGDPAFVGTVAEAAVSGDPRVARSGSWLLKRWTEAGNSLPVRVVAMIVENLDEITRWEAQLQFCQLLASRPEVMTQHPDEFAAFLRRCYGHRTPFVRAWAITAFSALAMLAPRFGAEADEMVRRGRDDPAKSVQARMRRITSGYSRG